MSVSLVLLDDDDNVLAINHDGLLTEGVTFHIEFTGVPSRVCMTNGDNLLPLTQFESHCLMGPGDTFVVNLEPTITTEELGP